MENIPTNIELIIESVLSGRASESEIKQLQVWIDESPVNRDIWQKYRKTNDILLAYKKNGRYDSHKAWKSVKPLLKDISIHKNKKHINDFSRWFYRIAAVFILAFMAGMSAMYYTMDKPPSVPPVHYSEYVVPYGSKAKVILPDNSTVWLNAGSKLRYGSSFNQADRNVFIEGEGYFDVTKNVEKPFLVTTSTITLKVLGTSFNLKAYPEEQNIETTVESGSVQVLSNIEGQQVGDLVLKAGQKVTVVRSENAIANINLSNVPEEGIPVSEREAVQKPAEKIQETIVSHIDTKLYTSWKDNRWFFEKENLGSLSVKLERRYNVQISFTDKQLEEYTFTGSLEDETLEQVLEVIKLSAPIDYRVKQNKVTLSRNKWVK